MDSYFSAKYAYLFMKLMTYIFIKEDIIMMKKIKDFGNKSITWKGLGKMYIALSAISMVIYIVALYCTGLLRLPGFGKHEKSEEE